MRKAAVEAQFRVNALKESVSTNKSEDEGSQRKKMKYQLARYVSVWCFGEATLSETAIVRIANGVPH